MLAKGRREVEVPQSGRSGSRPWWAPSGQFRAGAGSPGQKLAPARPQQAKAAVRGEVP